MTRDIASGDLIDMVGRLQSGEATPLEVTEAALAQIAAKDGEAGAFVAVEAERALDEARRLTAMQPAKRGPLAGAPYARKDLFGRAGQIVSAGSPLRADARAGGTATVLRRLDEAGGVDLGRLHMAEWALSPTGYNAHTAHPRNPWDRARVPGGSSSGSGIAVAMGFVPFALGSDTGGSIRHPAGMCGLTGVKPTYGAVSRAGGVPLSWTLDCMGPIARSARDCALLMTLLAGEDPADPTCARAALSPATLDGDLRGVTLARPGGYYADGLDREVETILEAACGVLAGRGVRFGETVPPDMEMVHALAHTVMTVEAASVLGPHIRAHPEAVGRQVRERVAPGLAYGATTYADALRMRAAICRDWLERTLDGADAAILPLFAIPTPTVAETTEGPADEVSAVIATLTRFTRAINYLGLPSVAVPAGFDRNGMPLAFQLVGRPFDDMALLRIADAFQRDTGHHLKRPPGAA